VPSGHPLVPLVVPCRRPSLHCPSRRCHRRQRRRRVQRREGVVPRDTAAVRLHRHLRVAAIVAAVATAMCRDRRLLMQPRVLAVLLVVVVVVVVVVVAVLLLMRRRRHVRSRPARGVRTLRWRGPLRCDARPTICSVRTGTARQWRRTPHRSPCVATTRCASPTALQRTL
jgi:hypothetical protein